MPRMIALPVRDGIDTTIAVPYTAAMASDEDKAAAALAARLVELSMGALIGAAFANQPDPRATFKSHLRGRLEPAGMALVAADLGQGLTGPVWILTLRLFDGSLISFQASVDPGVDPLAASAGDAIAQRIIAYLQSHDLVQHDARAR